METIEGSTGGNDLNNNIEYQQMVMNMLASDPNPVCRDICFSLKNNKNDVMTDIKLRELSKTETYDSILPLFRELLGFAISSDEECVKSLKKIRNHLTSSTDKHIVQEIINFVKDDKDLDESIVPEIDLITFIDKIPDDIFPCIYRCIDYIAKISEFEHDT